MPTTLIHNDMNPKKFLSIQSQATACIFRVTKETRVCFETAEECLRRSRKRRFARKNQSFINI